MVEPRHNWGGGGGGAWFSHATTEGGGGLGRGAATPQRTATPQLAGLFGPFATTTHHHKHMTYYRPPQPHLGRRPEIPVFVPCAGPAGNCGAN